MFDNEEFDQLARDCKNFSDICTDEMKQDAKKAWDEQCIKDFSIVSDDELRNTLEHLDDSILLPLAKDTDAGVRTLSPRNIESTMKEMALLGMCADKVPVGPERVATIAGLSSLGLSFILRMLIQNELARRTKLEVED